MAPSKGGRAAVGWRIACTVVAILVLQALVFSLALVPVAALWVYVSAHVDGGIARAAIYSVMAAPSYVAFALLLTIVSPLASRLTGARTPADVQLRLAEMEWPLMQWARYAAAAHLVRLVAGPVFCGSPVWSMYLRLDGARVGRGVYVNTVSIGDHNLLELGDGVVIGADVHISGHTVEGGTLKTATVRLGRQVTVGLGSIVSIGVDAGDGAQVGALSFVPKYMRLEPGTVYVGVPAGPLPKGRPHDLHAHQPWPAGALGTPQ